MPAYTFRPAYQLNAVDKITTKKQPSVSTNGSRAGSKPIIASLRRVKRAQCNE